MLRITHSWYQESDLPLPCLMCYLPFIFNYANIYKIVVRTYMYIYTHTVCLNFWKSCNMIWVCYFFIFPGCIVIRKTFWDCFLRIKNSNMVAWIMKLENNSYTAEAIFLKFWNCFWEFFSQNCFQNLNIRPFLDCFRTLDLEVWS